MEYLKISEAAKKWGLSERGVQALCARGKIEGAARFGRSWMIPKDAKKPLDGRTKVGKKQAERHKKSHQSYFGGIHRCYTLLFLLCVQHFSAIIVN